MKEQEKLRGLTGLVKNLMAEPLPKGIGWLHSLGSTLLALIVVQIVTGVLLALYYSPNAEVAYESIQFIDKNVLFGNIIRALHYFAASGMVVVISLHILRTFFFGAYKRPRQWTWVLGVCLFLVVLAFAFTGYLLPWDMKAYFATKVGIHIAGTVPLLGDAIIKILQGGPEMGTITLSRFFAIHVVILPMLLLLIVGAHLFYIRLYGETPPWQREGEPVSYTDRFYPMQLFRDSAVAFAVVGVLLTLAIAFGAPLGQKADPNSTSFVPRPDWYFYSLFQLLKIFEGNLEFIGAVIIPGIFFLLLFFLPFLDKNPERRLSARPVAVTLGSIVLVAIVSLTTWGAYTGEKAKSAVRASEPAGEADTEKPLVADSQKGAVLFTGLKCAECHSSRARGLNIPPGLEFAGNKYKEDWLIHYLKDPYRIRWQAKDERPMIRMPDFELSDQEARDIAAYLMTLRQDSLFPEHGFNWAEADSDMVVSGQGLVFEYGCFGCHKIRDKGQNIAPDLTHVGAKLKENYMFHLIKHPDGVVPDTPMKDFKIDDLDVEDIVAYLRQLKK